MSSPCIRPYFPKTINNTKILRYDAKNIRTTKMKEKSLPQIKIKYGWLLYPIFKKLYEAGAKHTKSQFPTEGQVEGKVKAFQQAWAPYELKILQAMCSVLELDFYQNIVDVYVAGPSPSFSDPMVITSELTPDRFLDVLTHELLHRLLTHNTRELDVKKIWSEMFPNRERTVRNHVIVHSVHKYIYLEILKEPHRLEKDINKTNGSFYKESWQIVEEGGYQNIIAEFKKHYSDSG